MEPGTLLNLLMAGIGSFLCSILGAVIVATWIEPEKLKALAQWFCMLERVEHRHWCTKHLQAKHGPWSGAGRDCCDGSGGSRCWLCVGITCANIDEKDCPACLAQIEREAMV